MTPANTIKPATGKLGILLPGMGAVATTFIAGVEAIRSGLSAPIGSMTQMGTIRLGKRTDNNTPRIKDFVPLADLKDLVFGGWDIFEDNAYVAAKKAGVLNPEHLEQLRPTLEKIKPMPAVFDQKYVKRLDGPNVKKGANWWEKAEALKADIARFKEENGCDRLVAVWCGSTEIFITEKPVHQTLTAFEAGLKANDPDIAPSMVYAYACLSMDVPFANGAPNLTVDIPAIQELARERHMPIAGKDFKTGQTLVKTVLAPMFKARTPSPSGRDVRCRRLSPSRGRNAATYTSCAMRRGQRPEAWVIAMPPMLWPTSTAGSGRSASAAQMRSA